MNERIAMFARRVEDDPFFLASALREYAQSENLDESGLATVLGCSVELLTLVAICRRPHPEPGRFQRDIDLIAARFDVRAGALAEIVRRAEVIAAMRRGIPTERGLLIAARERDDEDPPEEEQP
jgi:hypothetical protein